MSYSAGTKVTQDPQAFENQKIEKAGTVTSDSLAGESLSQGGDFGSTTNAAASLQPSSGSNLNNTDISGATTLQPAPDAEARQASEAWSETAQLNAGRGLSTSSGSAGTAPSYTTTAVGDDKPHGSDITEGGFSEYAPNASFNNDIGGRNDPGRAALSGFQHANAAGNASGQPAQSGISNDGQFDSLADTSA